MRNFYCVYLIFFMALVATLNIYTNEYLAVDVLPQDGLGNFYIDDFGSKPSWEQPYFGKEMKECLKDCKTYFGETEPDPESYCLDKCIRKT